MIRRMSLFRVLKFAGCLAAALTLGATGPARAQAVKVAQDVFGSSSLRSSDLKAFPKWRGAVARYARERRLPTAPCRPGIFTRCPQAEWETFLAGLKGLAPERQMREVNAFLNRAPYILDIVNWKVNDYWASPFQFLRRDGDCEDYAIAKFMSLRALGFANDRMKIVVLRDLNLRLAHAVLAVELDGRRYVLDNQVKDVVPDTVIRHYKPIYSVNETHWWLHRAG